MAEILITRVDAGQHHVRTMPARRLKEVAFGRVAGDVDLGSAVDLDHEPQFVRRGAGVVAALSAHHYLLLFPSMWALGVGWNFGMIGGSTLLTESFPLAQRVQVQGSADLVMSFCGGIAGLSAGFIRKAIGDRKSTRLNSSHRT